MPNTDNLEQLERAAMDAESKASEARSKAAAAVAAQEHRRQLRLNQFDAQIANEFDRAEEDRRVELAQAAFREAVSDDEGDPVRAWVRLRGAIASRTNRHQEAQQAVGRLRLAGTVLPGRLAGRSREDEVGSPTPAPHPDFVGDFVAAVERSARSKAEAAAAELRRAREAAGDGP